MPPESIVTSLEMSKKLKEAGWCEIAGYEGVYFVNRCGEVMRLYKDSRLANKHGSGKRLKPFWRGRYLCVSLSKNNQKWFSAISRLVAIAFIPNPENKPQVNHKDGDRSNNNDWNLEWATPRENTIHAIEHGLRTLSPTIRGPFISNVA